MNSSFLKQNFFIAFFLSLTVSLYVFYAPIYLIGDRAAYIENVISSQLLAGIGQSSEFMWFVILWILNTIFQDANFCLFLIQFFSLLCIYNALFSLCRSKAQTILVILFTLCPLYNSFLISNLRQLFAFALFINIYLFFLSRYALRYQALLASSISAIFLALIHSSFFVVPILFTLDITTKLFNSKLSIHLQYIVKFIIFALSCLLMMHFSSLIGGKQNLQEFSISGVGLILYIPYLIYSLRDSSSFTLPGISNNIMFFYFCAYFLTPYSSRLILPFIPFVFLDVINNSRLTDNKTIIYSYTYSIILLVSFFHLLSYNV